jgi:hypothetical protein
MGNAEVHEHEPKTGITPGRHGALQHGIAAPRPARKARVGSYALANSTDLLLLKVQKNWTLPISVKKAMFSMFDIVQ